MKTTLIALLLITSSIPLFAQKQPKAQDSTVAPTTQKSITAPVSRQALRLPQRDKLDPYFKEMVSFLDEQGKSNDFNQLYSFLYRTTREKDPTLLQTSSLITANTKSILEKQDEYTWEMSATRLLWNLLAAGYTSEVIEQLGARGLNVIETIENRDDHFLSEVLTADLVLIGTIDTLYNDDSFGDAHQSSFVVTVNEVFRGDNKLKKIIIRQPGLVQNNQYIMPGSDGNEFCPQTGGQYLLFLYKSYYEFLIKHPSVAHYLGEPAPITRYDSTSVVKRRLCFSASPSSLALGYHGEYLQQNVNFPEHINSIEIRNMLQKAKNVCKQYGTLLPKRTFTK
jgi:hypothetical protein